MYYFAVNYKHWTLFSRCTLQIRKIPRTPTYPNFCHLRETVWIWGFLHYFLLLRGKDIGKANLLFKYDSFVSAFQFNANIVDIPFYMLQIWLFITIMIIFFTAERRRHSRQLEFLFTSYVRMLYKNRLELKISKVWESIVKGMQIYPFNPHLHNALVEISHLYTSPNKLRWTFDDHCQK